jgi:hypothetical protein
MRKPSKREFYYTDKVAQDGEMRVLKLKLTENTMRLHYKDSRSMLLREIKKRLFDV